MRHTSSWRCAGLPRSRRSSNAVRRWSIGALALLLAVATDARAVGARVRWLPSAGPSVVGYDVFVRQRGQEYGAPIDVGLPPPGSDGAIVYDVGGLASSATYYFSVTARGSGGTRSACAGELVLGDPGVCVVEQCCPGDGCGFGGIPDRAPCDATDACRLCRGTTCTAAAESPLDTQRLKVVSRGPSPRTNASGTFVLPDTLSPTTDGVAVSIVDATGAVLLASFVAPEAVRANPAGTSYSLSRKFRDGTIRALGLRLRGGVVTVRTRLSEDPGASRGPLGWVVASGQSCGRSPALDCSTTANGLICR